MQPDADVIWDDTLRHTLRVYDHALIRAVCGRLVKPRNRLPIEELIDRALEALDNPVVIDRRLKELEPIGRRLLALMGHSRQPRWKLAPLVEMLAALGNSDGPGPIFALFEAGLLYPCLPETDSHSLRLASFEQWLGRGGANGLTVFALPVVLARAIGEDLDLPCLATEITPTGGIRETDSMEMLLRISALLAANCVRPAATDVAARFLQARPRSAAHGFVARRRAGREPRGYSRSEPSDRRAGPEAGRAGGRWQRTPRRCPSRAVGTGVVPCLS